MSPMQERMFVIQNQGKENDPMFKMYLNEKKNMEINPSHPIIQKMLELAESNDKSLSILAKFFYDATHVGSGWEVRSPQAFSARADQLLREYLGIEQEQVYSTQEEEKKEEITHDEL